MELMFDDAVRGESENNFLAALAPASAGLCQPPPLDAVV